MQAAQLFAQKVKPRDDEMPNESGESRRDLLPPIPSQAEGECQAEGEGDQERSDAPACPPHRLVPSPGARYANCSLRAMAQPHRCCWRPGQSDRLRGTGHGPVRGRPRRHVRGGTRRIGTDSLSDRELDVLAGALNSMVPNSAPGHERTRPRRGVSRRASARCPGCHYTEP